ncbi:MAG: hypothetical protein IJ863_03600 [Spirochaetales bacterium]|nr:hypothetical protein [Spirochaetales bacterium]
MRHLIETFLDSIGNRFPMKELPAGEFSEAKVSIMRFRIRHWDAGLLGNVSYMCTDGLMKMESLIINPTRIDMPLLSMDTILAMGRLSVYAEIYDTTVNGFDQKGCQAAKDSLSGYSEVQAKPHWYDGIKLPCSMAKKVRTTDSESMGKGLERFLEAYVSSAVTASEITDPTVLAEKTKRCNAYVDGLLANGGPSTDVFLKKYGKERTAQLYHDVLFGKAYCGVHRRPDMI